jgi:hypothetical protein
MGRCRLDESGSGWGPVLVINLGVPKMSENFLTSLVCLRLSRTLLHGVSYVGR